MPPYGTPTEEYDVKPHEPWSQKVTIHLFQEKFSSFMLHVRTSMK